MLFQSGIKFLTGLAAEEYVNAPDTTYCVPGTGEAKRPPRLHRQIGHADNVLRQKGAGFTDGKAVAVPGGIYTS